MIIFYSGEITDNSAVLTGDEFTHCTKVLRKQKGDQVFITDGRGVLYDAVVTEISKSAAKCKINGIPKQQEARSNAIIAITPTKNPGRLEWFAEKATEIGIAEIILFYSERSEKKNVNSLRLQNILISAMKQSGNLILPRLTVYKNTDEVIRHCAGFKNKYIAYCGENAPYLPDILKGHTPGVVMIGPEGDFTSQEVEAARNNGFQPVSLGKSRLRTETAGLVSLMMMHLSGQDAC